MPPALPDRPPAHLDLWRRFHDAVERDAERLADLLVDRPDIEPHELAVWWDRFAPAITQCVRMAHALVTPLEAVDVQGAEPRASSLLSDTLEMIGLAAGMLSSPASAGREVRGVAPVGRADMALRARGLVKRHEAISVAYLSEAVSPDDYRWWERRAIASITYRHIAFLAPWLLDTIGGVGRDALWRHVPHLREVRCDDAWARRYKHVTAVLRRPGRTRAP